MREQGCDDGEHAQRASEAQGEVAFVSCFRPVSPCYFRQAAPPRPAPGCARFLFLSWSLRRNHRRQVVPGVLLFCCYLQEPPARTDSLAETRSYEVVDPGCPAAVRLRASIARRS